MAGVLPHGVRDVLHTLPHGPQDLVRGTWVGGKIIDDDDDDEMADAPHE